MAIKTKQGEELNLNVDYPKLMQNNDGYIFYMVRKDYGLPLTGTAWTFNIEDFANFSNDGYIFTDYNEPITIQNEIK